MKEQMDILQVIQKISFIYYYFNTISLGTHECVTYIINIYMRQKQQLK